MEDHALVRQGVLRLLMEHWPSCSLLECTNAREARRLLAQRNWDFILLDQGLPDAKGLDLVSLVKKPNRVLVISVDSTQELMHKAYDSGCGGFISKSEAPTAFVDAVQAVVAGDRHFPKLNLAAPPAKFSKREAEISQALLGGKPLNEIAADLNITYGSAQTYKKRVFGKLGVTSLVEFIKKAALLP